MVKYMGIQAVKVNDAFLRAVSAGVPEVGEGGGCNSRSLSPATELTPSDEREEIEAARQFVQSYFGVTYIVE